MRNTERHDFEAEYINKIDKPSDKEILERSHQAEDLVVDSIDGQLSGYKARLASLEEDSNSSEDLAMHHQVIDVVAYRNEKPAFGIQVTTSEDKKIQIAKMKELLNNPFIRLTEMKPTDTAIPKVLVFIDRMMAKAYESDPSFAQRPEAILKVIDGALKSLTVVIAKTKNPKEVEAVGRIIEELKEEQKKLVH